MAGHRETIPRQPGEGGVPSLPAKHHAGVLLSLDERARRQVRIKQLNMQKARLAAAGQRGPGTPTAVTD